MRTEYKRDISHNYLILQGDIEVDTSSYQVRMLEGNVIPSVLKCRVQGLDGNTLFYYDITSRQSVASFFEQKKLTGEDLRMLFEGFVCIMEEMAEYLMNPEMLMLAPEYMYLDPVKRKISFCCLPGFLRPVQEQFREFTEYCLPRLAHEDPEAVMLGYGVYRRALEPGFQLEYIKEAIYHPVKEDENKEIREEKEPDPMEIRQEEKFQSFQEPEECTDTDVKNPVRQWKWLPICAGCAVFLLLVSVACFMGYLPWISAEAAMAVAVLILGIGAVIKKMSEKKRKKLEESQAWREKVREEFKKQEEMPTVTEKNEDLGTLEFQTEEKSEKQEPDFQEREEEYGETVVLSQGRTSGPASLVSREPGELPTIYLEQELTVIGKLEAASDVVLPLSTVSRVHARIRKKEKEYYLADLNSRNGTSVNGRMLKPDEEYLLKDEDQVDFAQARYVFLE